MGRQTLVSLVVIGLLVLGSGVLSPPPVLAAFYTVDSTADGVDVDPFDGACLTALNTCTLRAAIMQADALAGDDVIGLPAGTYTLSLGGAGEDGGQTGDLDIRGNIRIGGTDAATTIIDANGIDRVFDVQPGARLTLAKVTVRGGRTTDIGAGVRNRGSLVLGDQFGAPIVISGNDATGGAGGGIGQPSQAGATISTASGTVVESNVATQGGGIYVVDGNSDLYGATIASNTGGGITVSGGTLRIAGTVRDNSGGGVNRERAAFLSVSGTVTRNSGGGVNGGVGGPIIPVTGIISENTSSRDGAGINGLVNLAGGSVVQNNTTTGNGGGASLEAGSIVGSGPGSFDTTFDGNVAAGGGGGLVGAATVNKANFTNNHADTGGGLLLTGGSITYGTISQNSARVGGGISLQTSVSNDPVCSSTSTLAGVRIANNTATETGGGVHVLVVDRGPVFFQVTMDGNTSAQTGGGLFVNRLSSALSPPLICQSTVKNNTAAGSGGGIWTRDQLGVQESTVSGNTATNGAGGGIAFSPAASSGSPPLVALLNSTVSGNTATNGTGGGVAFLPGGSAGALSVNYVTIDGNTAPSGGGGNIFSATGGQFDVSNTIVSNATGGNCAGAGLTSLGHNIASDGTCPFSAAGDLPNTNPLLGPLQSNGGQTFTHALQSGSPALDAGDNARCPATDQRGEPRPRDRNNDGQFICDIGSFEALGAYPPPPATATPTPTPGPTACSPRPRVATEITRTGDGRLQVKLSVTANPGLSNELRSITWRALDNATVTGLGAVQAGQTTPFPPGTTSATFFVGRVTPGQAATVQVGVTDACGEWPTFFGGGPTAF